MSGGLRLEPTDDLVIELFVRARELGLLGQDQRVGGELEVVADRFGVPVRRVRDWRERGCPARRIGRRLWFDFAEVAAWVDRQARV